MKYDVFITYADYEAAQRAGQPFFARRLSLTLGLMTAIVLAYLELSNRPIDKYTLAGIAAVWCAMIYMNRVSLPGLWRREFQRTERQSYTIELTEDMFGLTSEFEKAAWPWPSFCGWRDSDKCFLLYYNKGLSSIIIPKHIFDSPDGLSEVRERLEKSLGKPGRLG